MGGKEEENGFQRKKGEKWCHLTVSYTSKQARCISHVEHRQLKKYLNTLVLQIVSPFGLHYCTVMQILGQTLKCKISKKLLHELHDLLRHIKNVTTCSRDPAPVPPAQYSDIKIDVYLFHLVVF